MGITESLPVFAASPELPGQFLYVSREAAAQVQFNLRLFNGADRSASWGTELPVLREDEFARTVQLINVPLSTEFRTTLRIYGLTDAPVSNEMVTVTVYDAAERLLASRRLPFNTPHVLMPPYAQILSLREAVPEIATAERVRILIEPDSQGSQVWAFASVTANGTQHVTLVTP